MKKQFILYFLILLSTSITLKSESLDSLDQVVRIDTVIAECRNNLMGVPGGYTQTGLYIDTTYQNGQCTIWTTDLTVYPLTIEATEYLCVDPQNSKYTAGTFVTIEIDENGCEYEKTTVVNLIPQNEFLVSTLCEGDPFFHEGIQIDSDTTILIELFDGSCFYTAYQTINFLEPIPDQIEEGVICVNDMVLWNGQELTEPGQYISPSLDANGCFFNEILNLSLGNTPETISDTISLCVGEVLVYDGLTIEEDGEFFLAYEGNQACVDSVLLTVEFKSEEVIHIIVCEGTDIPDNPNDNGSCLTTTTLVTVLPSPPDLTTSETLCLGDSLEWNGVFYSEPIVISLVKENESGCTYLDNLILNFVSHPSCTTSTIDHQETTSFEIYPNPASDILVITRENQTKPVKLEIYSSQGILIKRSTIQNDRKTIDITDMDSGVYFIKVIDEKDQVETQSFVKL